MLASKSLASRRLRTDPGEEALYHPTASLGDYPDWALEAAVREEADQFLKLAEERQPSSKEVMNARAALEAGDFQRAIELLLQLAPSPDRGS